ncbi:hypothetical protein Q3G72_025857 [Acer saccharum]|nr:hypothetical protein Q3G72_025857 [Acer saccharum]
MMSAYRLVLVLISFVLLQTICEAGLLPAKRTINITNDVYVQSELDLTVHCKSCDDDLGEHVLPFKGLIPTKRTINITNDVYIESELDLIVHCKSGDDDLGQHVLPFKDLHCNIFTSMMSACRLVLVLISFVLLQTICEAGLLPAKRTINITNDVYVQSKLDLTVHCKSCDDDLGEHVLPFKGWYSSRFRP